MPMVDAQFRALFEMQDKVHHRPRLYRVPIICLIACTGDKARQSWQKSKVVENGTVYACGRGEYVQLGLNTCYQLVAVARTQTLSADSVGGLQPVRQDRPCCRLAGRGGAGAHGQLM